MATNDTIKEYYKFVCFKCKKVAFYLDHRPANGERLTIESVKFPHGQPVPYSPVICNYCYCRLPLTPKSLYRITEGEYYLNII